MPSKHNSSHNNIADDFHTYMDSRALLLRAHVYCEIVPGKVAKVKFEKSLPGYQAKIFSPSWY